MAPISLPLNDSPDIRDAILRCKWETSDLDPKAVGGHLTLGKTNSTPVGYDFDFCVPPPPFNKKAAVMPPQQQPQPPHQISNNIETNGHHRRLDRSQSDPLGQRASLPHCEGRIANGAGAGPGAATTASSSRYKTELCRPFAETGFCKYGDKCQFAHGQTELRAMPRHPKYKTELCRTFHTTGLCGYGTRCHFIHNAEERRSPAPSHSSDDNSSPPSSSAPMGMQQQQPQQQQQQQQQQQHQHQHHHIPTLAPATLPYIQATEDQSSSILTPPHSLNGSPTTPAGTFFNNAFNLFAQNEMLDVPALESMVAPQQEFQFNDTYPVSYMSMQETPPGSPPQSSGDSLSSTPVESLVGEVDNLALNSDSVASCNSFAFENGKYLRLPIFETLTEV